MNSCFDTLQGPVGSNEIVLRDSIAVKPDSICVRNSIADVTYSDTINVVTRIKWGSYNKFPFLFVEKNKQIQAENRTFLLKHLRSGQDLPSQPLHEDWIIGILLVTAFLFSFIRGSAKNGLPEVKRFSLIWGSGDLSSGNTSGLFYWQSTILNLISFLTIALFAYCSAFYYNLIPVNLSGIYFWLIAMALIISSVTLRHIVCIIAGKISGERELFIEYLHVVYQFYRFGAVVLMVIIILMSYTVILPVSTSITSGIIVLCIMYLIRILRLMIFFINRNISIFYFILYICALEILPVLVLLKYVSGLV
jgi:hypothetical protein